MARLRYKYNPEACRYEPFRISGKLLWKKITVFLGLAFLLGGMGFIFCLQYFQTYDELLLERKNNKLKVKWSILKQRIEGANSNLGQLIKKDDHTYRVILDTSPLDPTIREAGTGGRENLSFRPVENFDYITESYEVVNKLEHKVDIEMQSYEEIDRILSKKIAEWAARPAIQPISNTDLQRLHLTYGARLHPIFKVWKDHKGLDFAAPEGTPVYATGDGKVSNVYFSDSYGRVVFIDHDNNFQTRYAHLHKFNVIPGEPVKRGQIIGYVGNTGHSVSAHLHYEILINGQHVNPINFFQRDLSNQEYEKLIGFASLSSNSLD